MQEQQFSSQVHTALRISAAKVKKDVPNGSESSSNVVCRCVVLSHVLVDGVPDVSGRYFQALEQNRLSRNRLSHSCGTVYKNTKIVWATIARNYSFKTTNWDGAWLTR